MCLFLLVQDFCMSFGVVRNMNEDQMIECADILLDECDNFRMEDYVMMFAMAKRDKLGVKIMDRLDIQVISQIHNAYSELRYEAGERLQQKDYNEAEARFNNPMAFPDQKQIEAPEGSIDATEYLRNWRLDAEREIREEQRRKDEEMRARRDKDAKAFLKLLGMDENGDPLPPSEDLNGSGNTHPPSTPRT